MVKRARKLFPLLLARLSRAETAVNLTSRPQGDADRRWHRRRAAAWLAGDEPGTARAGQGHGREGRTGSAGREHLRHRHGRGTPQLRARADGGEPRRCGCWSTRAMSSRRGSCSRNSIRSTSRIASPAGELAAERAGSTIRAAEAQLAEAQSRAQVAVVGRTSFRRAARAGVRQPGSRPTPRGTKRMPRRPPSMRRPPNWRRHGATTTGRWPMSLASASCARRRGS